VLRVPTVYGVQYTPQGQPHRPFPHAALQPYVRSLGVGGAGGVALLGGDVDLVDSGLSADPLSAAWSEDAGEALLVASTEPGHLRRDVTAALEAAREVAAAAAAARACSAAPDGPRLTALHVCMHAAPWTDGVVTADFMAPVHLNEREAAYAAAGVAAPPLPSCAPAAEWKAMAENARQFGTLV
jgi:hypothetical protein